MLPALTPRALTIVHCGTTIGFHAQGIRISLDHEKDQDDIHHQADQADAQIGEAPSIGKHHVGEEGHNGKLAKATSREAKADGKPSSFLKPLAQQGRKNR